MSLSIAMLSPEINRIGGSAATGAPAVTPPASAGAAPQADFGERVRRTALLIGCDLAHRDEVTYGRALGAGQIAIGPACRLCERQGCLARGEPPVTRPLGLDEMAAGFSAFDFQ